jgi:hypothetical protein
MKQRKGGMGGSMARRDAWKEGDGGPGPNRRAASRLTAARLRRARVARRCPNKGEERKRERREAGRVGRPGEKGKLAEPEETGGFLIYSNKIQTSSNGFDQKVDLLGWKNSK